VKVGAIIDAIAAIGAAVGACDASAMQGTLTYADVTKILPTARIPWSASHCYRRERVVIEPAAALPGDDVDGWTITGDPACLVHLGADLTRSQACTTLTHELGHLAGLGHSPNPRSIMYALPQTPRRCWRFIPRGGGR
jgi:Matrixin